MHLHLVEPQPVRLHVVTAGLPSGPPCDGSMTCSCLRCGVERSKIAAKGAGRAQFKVRPARDRRAA